MTVSRIVGRLAALTALLLAAAAPTTARAESAASGNVYIDERDTEVADMVATAAEDLCSEGAGAGGDTDVTAARGELLGALGGENVMLDILKQAENQDDLSNKLADQVEVTWLISVAAPIVISFVVLLVYLCCCWTCCPCCKCCRCCAKERETSLIAKAVLAAMLLLCLAGILYGGVQTLQGFDSCKSGFDDMACSSSKVLETTLSGQSNPYFIGMMPVLEKMWDLDQQFEDNSPMLNQVDSILDQTAVLEDAVTVASSTIKLLGDMMELSGNVNPASASGEDLKHTCDFCMELAEPLQGVTGLMQDGVGTALAAARSEVKSVLSPETRKDLQQTLRSASEPLISFKETVRDTFGAFVEPGQLDTLRGVIDHYLRPVLFIFFFWALLLFTFACLAAGCFVAREKTSPSTYSRHPHRLAGCVWCCAIFLVFPVLLLGGLMMAVSVPLAGVCLTMADLNSQMIRDIAPALGMNMTGIQGVMLSGIVDQCIATTDASLNANLMDIIFTENETTGERVYVRQQIVSTVQDPLDQAFAGIDTAQGGGSIALSNSTEILALRSLITGNPVDAMLLPVEEKISADATLQPVLNEPDLSIARVTSTRCSNLSVVGDMGPFTGTVMPGLANFGDRLKAYGTEIPSGTCLNKVTCTGTSVAACEAGNAFVDLKRKLTDPPPLESPIFRCNLFEDANGAVCDPINMIQDAAGQWQNDCLVAEGSSKVMKMLERPCHLSEFVTYVQDFDQRIERTLARLDSTTAEMMASITTDLRGLVDAHLLGPLLGIVDGITCGFMPVTYREVVDGMCYQGVVGFRLIGKSYVALSIFVLLLAVVMYALWRRAIDNVNASSGGGPGPGARRYAEGEGAEGAECGGGPEEKPEAAEVNVEACV